MDTRSPTKSPASDSSEDSFNQQQRYNLRINPRKTYQNNEILQKENLDSHNKSPIANRKNYQNLDDSQDSDDESREATLSPQKHDARDDRSQDREKTPYHSDESIKQNEKSSWLCRHCYIIFGLVAVLIIPIIVAIFYSQSQNQAEIPSKTINCSSLMSLNEKYPNQDEKLFKALQTGIEGMYKRKPQVPSVVTFFSTDEETMNELLNDVIKMAKGCINQSNDTLLLSYKDLNIEKFLKDNRKIISEYKQKLEESTIMVINNVNLIKSSVVGSLHSFADTVNPLVSESILYLTVKVPEKPSGNKASYIYSYLQDQWKDLAENIRDPLITRFIDQAFYVN